MSKIVKVISNDHFAPELNDIGEMYYWQGRQTEIPESRIGMVADIDGELAEWLH